MLNKLFIDRYRDRCVHDKRVIFYFTHLIRMGLMLLKVAEIERQD